MRYDQIEAILATGATKAERINILSSETQSKTEGIIDGSSGTDCDANYWERDYGNYDAVVALYDLLKGRDTQGTLSILGALIVNSTAIVASTSFSAASITAQTGDIDALTGEIKGAAVRALNGGGNMYAAGYYLDAQLNGTQGMFYKELYHAAALNEFNKFMYFDEGDLTFKFPHTETEYDTWAEMGGSWHFLNGDGNFAASLNQRGLLHLGGETDDPMDPMGIIMSKINARGSGGNSKILSQTLAADDRTTSTLLIEELLQHSTNPDKSLGLKFDIGATSKWDFLYNDASIANLSQTGLLTLAGGLTVTGGSIVASGLPIIGGGAIFSSLSVSGAISAATQTLSIGDVNSSGNGLFLGYLGLGDVTKANPWMRWYVTTLDQFFEMEDQNGYNLAFGFKDAAVNGDALLYGNFNKLVCQAGATYGTPSGEFFFEILSSGSNTGGILYASASETFALFIDANGCVKSHEIGGFPTGIGPATTGSCKIPGHGTTFDMNAQTTLNTYFAGVSDQVSNAIAIFDDRADGRKLVVSPSTSGDIVVIGGIDRGFKQIAAATGDMVKGDKLCSIAYTSTGTCTVTIATDLCSTGVVLTFHDADGNAGTNNITLDCEGSETIDGYGTKIMNTNGEVVRMYCDGTNWITF